MSLGGDVEQPIVVGAARGHGADPAVLRIHRHDGRARSGRITPVGVDRVTGVLLHLGVDRGVDAQAAAADHAHAVALDQLLLHVVEEVRLAPGRVTRAALEPERGLGGVARLGRRDVPVVDHCLQHLVAALDCGGRVAERVVLRGRLGQAREQRRLREREVLGGLVEEGHGCGVHADRGTTAHCPVGDRVEVLVEDPALGVLLLELGGQLGLPDLALEVALGIADVERTDQLLGDRGSALHGFARLEVLDPRANDRVEVDALVLVEALVLDRHRGLAHRGRHVAERHHPTDDVGLHEAESGAIRREDHGHLALVVCAQLVQVWCRGGHGQHVAGGRQDADDDDGGHEAKGQCDLALGTTRAPPPPQLSVPMIHGSGLRVLSLLRRPRRRIDRARAIPAASAGAAPRPPSRACLRWSSRWWR